MSVAARRLSLHELTAEMRSIEVLSLLMIGDEEEPTLEANLLI